MFELLEHVRNLHLLDPVRLTVVEAR